MKSFFYFVKKGLNFLFVMFENMSIKTNINYHINMRLFYVSNEYIQQSQVEMTKGK